MFWIQMVSGLERDALSRVHAHRPIAVVCISVFSGPLSPWSCLFPSSHLFVAPAYGGIEVGAAGR